MTQPVTQPAFDPVPRLAQELALPADRVAAVVRLLDETNTVPFIARYRKEMTGGLDEVQIRTIEERRAYLAELESRRQAIVEEIDKQGKLTEDLRARILACSTKAELEDLYLPYKPKRRTRGMIARERGLEPLSERILAQPPGGDPEGEAAAFVSEEKGVPDADAALKGARDICAELVAERADARAFVREQFAERGILVSEAAGDADPETRAPTKFEQYYDFREKVAEIPSHRYLAIRRGEAEGVLRAHIDVEVDVITARLERMAGVDERSLFAGQLREAIADSYRRLLAPSVENDVRVELKLRSDRAAVDVFADNLRNLLLAPPLGTRAVVGIDPGLRTGCKCAAIAETGAFLGHVTINIARGDAARAQAARELEAFVRKHRPVAVAVGNGTAGRETEQFARKTLRDAGLGDVIVVLVSEAGASVYSASDVAREEFPDLDLTIRGAISIARRLQDPLAELVKIEPKAIGVGQYQHDVHQPLLGRKLGEVVESCVNHVGVELNTASAPLLSYVAGIGNSLARKIVTHRDKKGAFRSRGQLLDVAGLGPRAFEQAAGFLRIRGGDNPLDGSAVHPERYDLVLRIAADLGVTVEALLGDAALARKIDVARYVGGGVGEPTLKDIIDELAKPGRDPRREFEPPQFRDDVNTLEDLQVGMKLQGVVTNVTAFGAFVDIGVHQDGLVHVSQLADRFVRDPSEVVKVGDKLTVRVLDVDLARKRIALSARSERPQEGAERSERAGGSAARPSGRDGGPGRGGRAEGRGDERGDRGRDGRARGDYAGNRPREDGGGRDRPRGGGGRGDRDMGSSGDRPRDGGKFSHNPFAAALGDLKGGPRKR